MKFTQNQFVKYLNVYRKMCNENEEIRNSLQSNELVFDYWIDDYYELIREMCDMTDEECDLDRYIFDSGKIIDKNGLEVELNNFEELYDWLVKQQEDNA